MMKNHMLGLYHKQRFSFKPFDQYYISRKIFRAHGNKLHISNLRYYSGTGLVTVVAVDIILTAQEAEAKGCSGSGTGFNASKGKCIKP